MKTSKYNYLIPHGDKTIFLMVYLNPFLRFHLRKPLYTMKSYKTPTSICRLFRYFLKEWKKKDLL